MNTDTPTLEFTARDEAWLRQIQIRPDTPEPIENPAPDWLLRILVIGALLLLAVSYWRGW